MNNLTIKNYGKTDPFNDSIIRSRELEFILLREFEKQDIDLLKVMLLLTQHSEDTQIAESYICNFCDLTLKQYVQIRKKLCDMDFITILPDNELSINYHNIYKLYDKHLDKFKTSQLNYIPPEGASKGEEKISYLLELNHIDYIYQYTNDTCRFTDTNRKAIFDFYLLNYNTIVEFDGEQHFHAGGIKWNTQAAYEKTVQHDKFKNQWCKDNRITLIRIPYTRYGKICFEDILPLTSPFIVYDFTTDLNLVERYSMKHHIATGKIKLVEGFEF